MTIRFVASALVVIALLTGQAYAGYTTPSPAPSAALSPAVPSAVQSAVDVPLWTFPSGAKEIELPAKFRNGAIIIRMIVGQRGVDMAVDTGSGLNFIDPSLIATATDLSQSIPTIATARFGEAELHDIQFATRRFYRHYDKDTEVVGILGYGFFLSAVVKIDYEHESLRIIDPSTFVVPDGAAVVHIDPTNRVPIVTASIGSATGSSFILDTGAATVVVFPRLAYANPDAFTKQQELKDDAQTIYYRTFWPLCGEIRQNPYAVSQVTLGSVGVRDWIVWKPDDKSCFQPNGIDGLIGYDFLRLFNVYVDYPDSRIILEPNKLYEAATNTIKP